jgi:pyruvate,orthophosphate dikinase
MQGLPVTVRLLDPPLHEFLPHTDKEITDLAHKIGVKPKVLREKRDSLHELNPMLGHRGCRLGVTFPEIPEIMIPLVGVDKELERLRALAIRVADAVKKEYRARVSYSVGTMIEVPRAAITADEVAEHADFFSFGTNDLTQMTMGLSRDDAGKFLPYYVETGVLSSDPFVSLDQTGVGFLVEHAVRKARDVKKGLKCGICGEHGGDPSSVIFCHKVGLDYVSCSPFRVPVARLAAAHAALGA